MIDKTNKQKVEKTKVLAISTLLITSIVITVLGTFLSIISIKNNISFTVFKSQVSGTIFGLVIIFLGIRYFFSVQKLKAEVYKATNKFSWSNFRKQKIFDSLSKGRS